MSIKTLGMMVSFILLASLMVACGTTPTPIPTEPPPTKLPLTEAAPAVGGAGPDLAGILWKWEAYNDEGGETHIPVDDPDSYTLVLQPDGEAQIQADCNQISWTYTVEGDRLTFNTLGPSTLASCGEGSRDQEYLGYLGQVYGYIVNEGRVFMDLRDQAGTIVFRE